MRLGAEGQRLDLFTIAEFLDHPLAVAPFKQRLRDYLGGVMPDLHSERPPADLAGGEVTNLRKNRFVGEYHLIFLT